MSKNNKFIIGLVVIMALVLLFISFKNQKSDYVKDQFSQTDSQPAQIDNQARPADTIAVTYSIEGLTSSTLVYDLTTSTTVLEGMAELTVDGVLVDVEIESYEGLGDLVTRIGDYRNGADNKYWQYYVNDEMPMVGADQYVLEDGDLVEWKFQASAY